MARKKSLLSKEAKAAIRAAKYQQHQAKNIYKDKVKEMRPYLKSLREYDLRKELSRGQKSFIEKAWKEYQELTIRPTKVFRTKNKKKLNIAQNIAHRDSKVKFDVAFIPTINDTATIKVKGDKLIVSSKYVEEAEILFNMRALASNPEKEIERLLRENPEYDQFVLMAGKYLWNGGISRGRVIDRITKHLLRYVPGGTGYEKRGPNSHYKNWAFGLIGLKTKQQNGAEEFLRDYHKQANERKSNRKRVRRKRLHQYGKKF